jgi:protein-tyrosine phosphatase
VTVELVTIERGTRLIHRPTVLNMRDLGGLRTSAGVIRRGLLYRAGSFVGISAGDAAWLVHAAGLRTVVDLRTEREVDRDGRPDRLLELGVEWLPVPFGVPGTFLPGLDGRGTAADFLGEYRRLLAVAATPVRAILRAIDRSGAPLVFACSLGKDRAGVVAALLLSALGVRGRDIARDYALSARSLRCRDELVEALALRKGLPSREVAGRLETRPATMRALLRDVARQRWIDGVDAALVERVRSKLVEPRRPA